MDSGHVSGIDCLVVESRASSGEVEAAKVPGLPLVVLVATLILILIVELDLVSKVGWS